MVKKPVVRRFKIFKESFKKYLLCLKYFAILILKPRWTFLLRFVPFLFLYDPLFWYLSQTVWIRSSNYWNSQSDNLRCVSDNVIHIREHKAPNYIYPRRKKNPLFHTIYSILCVMLDLHVPKIISYFIECVVLFLYLSSFWIHSVQKT